MPEAVHLFTSSELAAIAHGQPKTHGNLVQEAYEGRVLTMLDIFFCEFADDATEAKQRLQRGLALARQARNQALEATEE